MHYIDWSVLCGSILAIVLYGLWKTRKTSSMEAYFLGERELRWWTIGLSIMATQASGITFLSTPGQAVVGGMGFIQFYFGLPIAMVLLSAFVLPIYYKLKIFTAYEFLEQRYDVRVRQFTAFLFLVQRGLSAGLTIYAPSIILSALLGWDLKLVCILTGSVSIIYTVIGGSKAVSVTQEQQMIIIFLGLIVALVVAIQKLPEGIHFADAMNIAGEFGRLNAVDFKFDPTSRYNIWSGIIGGTFLSLSYFGTDQSQVQRYLSGKTLRESRLGLLFNGLIKVPMQFLVLLVGIMVFAFYQFQPAMPHFNESNIIALQGTPQAAEYQTLRLAFDASHAQKTEVLKQLLTAKKTNATNNIGLLQLEAKRLQKEEEGYRQKAATIIKAANPKAVNNDTDYIFLRFVLDQLPVGIIGLLLAAIFAASMSSTSSELNALATTTVIDFYRRSWVKDRSDQHYFRAGQLLTLVWGVLILLSAVSASMFENLIQAVNLIGSVFYGVMLGIFVCAFFIKYLRSRAVFWGALLAQLVIFYLNFFTTTAFLWFNLLGVGLVIAFAFLLQTAFPEKEPPLSV